MFLLVTTGKWSAWDSRPITWTLDTSVCLLWHLPVFWTDRYLFAYHYIFIFLQLAQFKIQLTKPDVDVESLETSIDTLSKIYQDVEARFSQDFVELKYNFFPTNLNVAYSVKYAGGTSPSDLTLCHNSKFLLKGIRASLRWAAFFHHWVQL